MCTSVMEMHLLCKPGSCWECPVWRQRLSRVTTVHPSLQPASVPDSPAMLLSCSDAQQLFTQKIFSLVLHQKLIFFSSRTSSTKLKALCCSSDHLQKHQAKELFPLLGSSLGSDYPFSPQVDLVDLHPFMPAGKTRPGSSAFASFGPKHMRKHSTGTQHK